MCGHVLDVLERRTVGRSGKPHATLGAEQVLSGVHPVSFR